ncbi:MAG: bifunctional riboflavin kinase/FAD synthetase [Thermodesulfobacteriota bacterium]
MKLIQNIYEFTEKLPNAVVTIGNFDGVHKGHQALLAEVKQKAAALSGTSVAVTFEPHPIHVLQNNTYLPHITLFDQKMELLSQTGIDVTVCIPFTKEFAKLTAKQFVEDILVRRIGMKAIVVGKDYAFGKNREGNVAFLQACGEQLGFEVIIKDWERYGGNKAERISSTQIRETVMEGDVEKARDFLGRYYQIRGTVEKGRDRGGKLLGFPTANIRLQGELCPKSGVYAVTVECAGGLYKGVANIGYSPTFTDHLFTIEVHIMDFNDNIYNQTIYVNFVKRLRDEKKFSDIAQLSVQINQDILAARHLLNE